MAEDAPGDRRMNEILLALADDEHLMGHRHSEWIGVAPFLEEDLAFASIGQDELGHASAIYELITDDVEHFVLARDEGDWRSCWLVEEPCRAWEDALVRHLLYDTAERYRWENLAQSGTAKLQAIAGRALREEDYHRRHATVLVERLLDATEESRRRITGALERLLPLTVGLLDPLADLAVDWRDEVTALFAAHDVFPAWLDAGLGDDQRTRRSEHFREIHDALTEVLRLDPAARW